MAFRIDQIDRHLAERSFAEFFKQGWHVLEPSTQLIGNWHIDLLCEYLEAVAAGHIPRLIINVPPRSGKSLLATVYFPCWVWLHNPGERFIFASYGSTLSTKLSLDRRTLIKSRWFQSRWGSLVRLAGDSNLKSEFANTKRGHMIATSVGASATGRGGNFLSADDLINPEQANSRAEREAAIRWFDETFSTRLDDKRTGRMLVVEQRTHQADLTGHLLEQGGWRLVPLPAIAETKTTIVFPRSKREIVREEGDILWEMREGRGELEAAKVRIGTFAFQAQYQQAPTNREGNWIKKEWLTEVYRASVLPSDFDSVAISLDTAFKTGAANDYSAAVVVGTRRGALGGFAPGHYLLDAWRGRVEFGALKRKVVELHDEWNANVILIEDAASGQSLIQELQSGTHLPIKPIKPDTDKESRVHAITPILESHRLILPEAAGWRADFLAELTSVPNGAHDDWVDALAQALNYLRQSPSFENAIASAKLQFAFGWVREGLSVGEAAARVGFPESELKHYIDHAARFVERYRPVRTDEAADDPKARWDASANRLIEAYRAGSNIQIDSATYKNYMRGRLLRSSDPDATKLAQELDRRFRIS